MLFYVDLLGVIFPSWNVMLVTYPFKEWISFQHYKIIYFTQYIK